MANHNELGKEGESLAAQWLEENGFKILFRNWRYRFHEIDIIATKKNVLHIIEVKTRNASRFGFPEDSVTKKKFRYLKKATDEFLHQYPGFKWIQYDILSITLKRGGEAEFFLLQDVFI